VTVPTVDEVKQICDVADPILRNLQITQCYHELSQGFARVTVAAANWCSFATWASKQAGQTIRREDLLRAFEDLFHRSREISAALESSASHTPNRGRPRDPLALRETICRVLDPAPAFERASEAVAHGNKKVFEEIGREFARFLATFREDPGVGSESTAQFCADLRPGEPPEGQGLLREAFATYCEARSQSDAKARAELMLFANLLVGLHEQTRLQPEIIEALDASLGNTEELKRRLLRVLLPGFWLRLRYHVARLLRRRLPLDDALERLITVVKREIREVITTSLMTLHLPNAEVLRLGCDLRGNFPEALQQITNPRLGELLARVDPTANSLGESGARDWADFADRMHFITDLFRAYQERQPLFAAPFTAEQVTVLKAGRRPTGRL